MSKENLTWEILRRILNLFIIVSGFAPSLIATVDCSVDPVYPSLTKTEAGLDPALTVSEAWPGSTSENGVDPAQDKIEADLLPALTSKLGFVSNIDYWWDMWESTLDLGEIEYPI